MSRRSAEGDLVAVRPVDAGRREATGEGASDPGDDRDQAAVEEYPRE